MHKMTYLLYNIIDRAKFSFGEVCNLSKAKNECKRKRGSLHSYWINRINSIFC